MFPAGIMGRGHGKLLLAYRFACDEHGFDFRRSRAWRGASADSPWERAQIQPKGSENPQVRLESGGDG